MEKLKKQPPWWQRYRRVKNRPRQQMSLEMIVRKSFSNVSGEYLQHCSLAGIKLVCDRDMPIRPRIFWSIVIGSTYVAVIYMLMNVWSATLSTPLIVTMDSSTFPIGEIDFPAVAVCNINRLSRRIVQEMAREIYNYSKHSSKLNDIEWYLLQGGRLLDYSYNETLRLRLLRLQHLPGESSEEIVKAMKRLAPVCEEMLVRCSWAGEIVPCSDIFTTRRTVNGHCCAFNYVLEYNAMGRPGKAKNLINNVMRQKQAGWAHGLIMLLDPLLEDYAYPLRNMRGFDVFLFDPTHFADPSGGRVIQRIAEPNEATVLELQSVKQIATREVRKYPLSTRKCLFHDEVPEHFGQMYSYSACVARCRIKTINSLCKCTPYFLPTSRDSSPTCSLVDLQCLNKYREKLLNMYPFHASSTDGLGIELLDSLYCPECLPDCELTKHSTKSSVIPFRDQFTNNLSLVPILAEDLNVTKMSNLAMVYIYQPTNDGVLDRLDVVFYWYEILTYDKVEESREFNFNRECWIYLATTDLKELDASRNIGGFAGILVGLSIISIVEIIYYFVRFIHVLCKNLQAYY